MISRTKVDCRIVLCPGVVATQRLQLMEIIEKWAVALTGTKPSKFIAASDRILFVVETDRHTASESLRQFLPVEFVREVVIDGTSWGK